MKTVFSSHSEVAHVWAQQSQESGRASRMFFEGPSIFSYGRHFEIARFITGEIVFVNCRSYSISTSKHQGYVRYAINHKTAFTVPSMSDHAANVRYYMDQASALPIKIKKARTRAGMFLYDMRKFINEGQCYIENFKIDAKLRREALALFQKLNNGDYSEIIAKQEEARKAALTKEREDQELERITAIGFAEAWKRGENVYFPSHLFPVMLRIKNGEIQTSRGANVPLEAALAMYAALKAGKPVHGITLGHYTVTSFDGQMLRVGCHEIPMTEMDRLYTLVTKMLKRTEV